MGVYDNILSGTFNTLGLPQQQTQPGMLGRGLPSDRLPQGLPGLPNPSPGSGMTPAQVRALGGWTVDPRTGQLAYAPPSPSNPAVDAATTLVGGVPLPRARPGTAPTSIDMAAINGLPKTAVSGQMQPAQSGGLLDMIFGPSKNGMSGLAGLLGGPQQGGLLQQLMGGGGGGQSVSPQPRAAPPPSYVAQGGALMPLTSMSGAIRRTDGDTGGGALTGSSEHGRAQWEASKIRDRQRNAAR